MVPTSLSSVRRRLVNPIDRLAAAWRFDRGVIAQPAQNAKRRHLLSLFTERNHDILVETGTYLGDTIAFFVPHARRIVSIEIDGTLHARAAERFANNANVELVLGDALESAPQIVSELEEPCLLWLDGHFSGGATGRSALDEPAVAILRRIAQLRCASGTTVVIDDLRRFGRESGVPALDSLLDASRATFPGASISVELDSLVIRAN
jgi:hypothetical protein